MLGEKIQDSLATINLQELEGAVTGKNTLIKSSLSTLGDMIVSFIPRLIGALLILWLGFKLAKFIKKLIIKGLEKRNATVSLTSFLTSSFDILFKVLVALAAMDLIGIKATSFIAILGAMGLAIGVAMQGTLQNFAGGVIIQLLRPFKVGDYIECNGYKGWVKDIHIFHTIIKPFNGRIVIVPNSDLATKSLINHTKEPQIRLDIVTRIAYGTDLNKAKEVMRQVIDAEPLILREPVAPGIHVSDFADNNLTITLWLWVKTEDYWTVWKRIRENIYNALYANGIEIPCNEVEVKVRN